MSSRIARNEGANAEILGVVILIGIFAITAGIISATVIASPAPAKVPAASIEITGKPEAIHITHSGGDPIPLADLVIRYVTSDGASGSVQGISDLRTTLFDDPTSTETAIGNGYNHVLDDDWSALVLVWNGGGGASVISSWDPTGTYGPLGPSAISSDVPTVQTPVPTQPVWPTPTTAWNATIQNITADFSPNRTAAETGGLVHFRDLSTGNVTVDAWSWNFGDGSPLSTLQNPDHPYLANGDYTVTLTASNQSTGASATKVIEGCIQVTDMPSPVDFDLTPTQGGVALTVVCTDLSASSPTLWRWTTIDGLTGDMTTVGPVGMNETYNPRIQTFTFYNPAGVENNVCLIMLEVWSPYFKSPISATKFVTVGPPMQAEFGANVTNWIGVAGRDGAPVQFTDLSVGIPQTWLWDFGDGVTSTEQNPVHTYTVGPNDIGTFPVTLTVTGWDQTPIPVTHNVMIYPPVIAISEANPTNGSAPLEVHFKDNSTGFPTSWLWNFGDGTPPSSEKDPVHTYYSVGKYRVTLFVERAEPHSVAPEIREIVILVGDEVIADFKGEPLWGDFPLTVHFTDLSINATKWSWTFIPGGTALMTQSPSYVYNEPGNYTVSLLAENAYRMDTETKVEYVWVTGPIAASFTVSDDSVETGTAVQFTDSSKGNPFTFSWDFGDGTTSTERNPLHVYSAAGTYTVTLTASNPPGPLSPGHTGTVTRTITVYDRVDASFDRNPARGLAPLTVQFTDTSIGSPTSWSWDFGDGITSTDRNPVHTYNDPGTYPVTLTASNVGSTDTTTALDCVVLVFGTLGAVFEPNQSAGPGPLTVQFTDQSQGNPIEWSWDFGDGATSPEQNPIHTYAASGTYDVILTVSHLPDTEVQSLSYPITVYDPLEATFTVNETDGGVPFTVQFTRGSIGGGTSWRWDFGDDTTSTELNPVHTYGMAGSYNATLTAWNDLRKDLTFSKSEIITGYVLPVAAFTADRPSGLAPLTVRFTDTSTGNPTVSTWNWNFGDGTTSTEQNPIHIFEKAGAYTVKLTVSNPAGPCLGPAVRTISVIGGDVPVASFKANVTGGVNPLTVQFNDTSTNNPTGWSWDFGDGTMSNEQNPIHIFENPGVYRVMLTASNLAGTGLASAPRTITVN